MRFKLFLESIQELPFTTDLSGYEANNAAWNWWQNRLGDDPYGKRLIQWWQRNAKSWQQSLHENLPKEHSVATKLQGTIIALAETVKNLWTNQDRVATLVKLKEGIQYAKEARSSWKQFKRGSHREDRSPLRDFGNFLETMIKQLDLVANHIGF